MPLDCQGETGRIFDAECLDDAIRRARLDDQIGREALHSLCVQRVDPHSRNSCQLRQESVRLKCHVVRRRVLHGQRLRGVVTVIQKPRNLVQSLRKCTAHCDVDFLKAPADAEQRNARTNRARDERQRSGITRGIV